MRILILTQKVNIQDPVLGFFHRWIEKMANEFEHITVICLELGEYSLPANVKVLSLGKETGRSRWKYVRNLAAYLWQLRSQYDSVFVHMNQEYVILAGWWWRLTGKWTVLWRNHPVGNWLTDVAARLVNRNLCTTSFSYTAKYTDGVYMPVGIDTENFKSDPLVKRQPQTILSLGRVSPVKRQDLIVAGFDLLVEKFPDASLTIVGKSHSPIEFSYQQRLEEAIKTRNLEKKINWLPSIPNRETVEFYSLHEVFINLTLSGTLDKTIFEAIACGALVLTSNKFLVGKIPSLCLCNESDDESEVASKLGRLLALKEENKDQLRRELRRYVEAEHGLMLLVRFISEALKK